MPEFSITVATSDAVKVDPLTGGARPEQTAVLHYQLEGGMVKRVTAGGPRARPRYPQSRSPSKHQAITIAARVKRQGLGRQCFQALLSRD